jgi:hypothetical protein
MSDRTKYLHRPRPGTIYFRVGGWTIARLPDDESSPEFAALYDRLLAQYAEIRKPVGRPRAAAIIGTGLETPIGAHVYFLRDGDRVKIGHASSLKQRISKLQVGSARPLTLIGVVPGSREIERFIHWQFRKHRERGEWFRIEGALAQFLAENFARDNADAESSMKLGNAV